MIFRDNLLKKIFFLASIFLFTVGIIIISFVFEHRIISLFDSKIANQTAKEQLIDKIKSDALFMENKLTKLVIAHGATDLSKEFQTIFSLHGEMESMIAILQSKRSANTEKIQILASEKELFSSLNFTFFETFLKQLQENTISQTNQEIVMYIKSELPSLSLHFVQFHEQLKSCYSMLDSQKKEWEKLEIRWLYVYRSFRLIIFLILLFLNYLFFKKTSEKITEIIKERDIYTMNIKSMNEILLEKRNFIKAVLNSVSVGIIVVEVSSKKIIDINKTALTVLAVSFEDVIDKSYSIVFPKDSLENPELINENQYLEKEIQFLNARNEKLILFKNTILANLNDKLCYVINIIDISAQKNTEKILLESEQFNRAIIENSPIGISVRDKFGRLLIGNNAWRKIWNITQERYEYDIRERKGLNFDDRDNYMKEHWEEVKKVYTDGGEYYIPELRLHEKEGRQTTWISHHFYALSDAKGDVEKVVILSEDISKRKETEDALYERDIRYKTLFEQANDAIFLEDYRGYIVDVNYGATSLSGYSKEELLTMKMSLLKINEPYDYLHSYEGLKNNQNIRYESKIKHKNGTEIPVEKTIAPFADRDNMLFLSIIRDISTRKKTEFIQSVLFDISNAVNTTKDIGEMYSRIHQLLGKIIDTTNFYIAVYDRETNLIEAAYYFDEMNNTTPPVQQMGQGLTAYVIRNQTSLFLTPVKREQLIQAGEIPAHSWKAKIWLGVPLRNQNHDVIGAMAVQSYTNENAFNENDLKILEFVSDQVAIAIERKKAEDLLRESEEKVRAFMNSATDSMTIWDKDGTLLTMNPTSLQMLNIAMPIDDLIGKNILEIVPFMKDSEMLTSAYQVYETGAPYFHDYVVDIKDLGERHFSLRVFKVGDNVGAIVSDITDRKIAEDKIRSSLQEKEVMLKEIHHRVKNNMQVVSSLLNLQSKYIVNEKDMELFKESQNRVKSMSLVHEKLYQSRNLANIDFNEYTRNLVKNLYVTYGVNSSRIQLLIDIQEIYLDINAAIPCGLIINELVSNSIKYAFPDGRTGMIKIIMKQDDNKVKLVVSDNGVGLPESLDIAETESLGLQLVHTLSLQLESEIEIQRTNGAAFSFEFTQMEQV